MVLLKYNTVTVTVTVTNETNKRCSRIIVKRKNVELIRHVLCVYISHKEAENITCGSCIALSATENGYNTHTIASENFTGMLNRQEMSDTSRTNTSRLTLRGLPPVKMGRKRAATMLTCNMYRYIQCHVCAMFVNRDGFLVKWLA